MSHSHIRLRLQIRLSRHLLPLKLCVCVSHLTLPDSCFSLWIVINLKFDWLFTAQSFCRI